MGAAAAGLLVAASARGAEARAAASIILGAILGWLAGHRADALEWQGATDSLTGLFNRGVFDRCLVREIAHARRHGHPLALLIVDLDALKTINDSLGHQAGDLAIQIAAAGLKQACRTEDLIARWGGDEFVVVAPYVDEGGAAELAARIQASVARVSASRVGESRPFDRRRMGAVSVSVGFAVANAANRSLLQPTALFATADRALYAAKATRGVNGVRKHALHSA